MSEESDVQLLAEGSGPLIRTLDVTTVIDEVITTVKMQVISSRSLTARCGGRPSGLKPWRQMFTKSARCSKSPLPG